MKKSFSLWRKYTFNANFDFPLFYTSVNLFKVSFRISAHAHFILFSLSRILEGSRSSSDQNSMLAMVTNFCSEILKSDIFSGRCLVQNLSSCPVLQLPKAIIRRTFPDILQRSIRSLQKRFHLAYPGMISAFLYISKK